MVSRGAALRRSLPRKLDSAFNLPSRHSETFQTIKCHTIMSGEFVETRVQGKSITVPSVRVNGRTVIPTGSWLKTAVIMDEELAEGETVPDPNLFLAQLVQSGLRDVLFTVSQQIPHVAPKDH